MARTSILIVFCALALAGCEGCAGDSTDREDDEQASTEATGGGETPSTAEDPGPPPQVRVRAETDRYERLAIAVENRGEEPARLASVLRVERKGGDGFEPAGEGLVLAPDCEPAATEGDEPGCVTLVPGAVLHPCECGGCDELEGGEHRFVARSCGGAHALESEPVALER